MVDVNTTRETKIEGDTVIIGSQITETMTKAEFINSYQQRAMEIQMIENQLHQNKTKLESAGPMADMTGELEELKKKFDIIKNMEGQDILIKKIQEDEVLLAKKQKDFKTNLTPTWEKIKAAAEAEPEKKEEPV